MKKYEKIYTELLKLKIELMDSKNYINDSIRYNDKYPETVSYYEGQIDLLMTMIVNINSIMRNIESGELFKRGDKKWILKNTTTDEWGF